MRNQIFIKFLIAQSDFLYIIPLSFFLDNQFFLAPIFRIKLNGHFIKSRSGQCIFGHTRTIRIESHHTEYSPCRHRTRIIIEDGVCKLADRSALAGSVATMDRLIRTLVQKAEIPLEDAVRMASETPSKFMGVYDRKGSLQKGKDADILILDQDLNIRAVWAMGKLVEGTYTL